MNLIVLAVIANILSILFGIIHFFWPRFFNWEKEFNSTSIVFKDTVLTTNFYMCFSIIISGLLFFSFLFILPDDKEALRIILCSQIILLFFRIVYSFYKPIRIPIKHLHSVFQLFFIIVLIMISISLYSLK